MRLEVNACSARAWHRSLLAALLAALLCAPCARAAEMDVEKDSLAAAIREHGHPCSEVQQMRRVTEGAADGFIVWEVRCDSGRFKVIFKGDAGSEVVRLD